MSITKYADIINSWDDLGDFAADIGVDRKHAYGMFARDSIPPLYWPNVVKGASKRGYAGITLELLAKLATHARRTVRVRRPTSRRRRAGVRR